MAHNGKMKFTKLNTQNYTNILYSDSDSDHIPDLKLPPIKGKKQKRRKATTGHQDEAFCRFWTVLKLLTGIVVFIALIVLAAVCFWALKRIGELQDQISACE